MCCSVLKSVWLQRNPFWESHELTCWPVSEGAVRPHLENSGWKGFLAYLFLSYSRAEQIKKLITRANPKRERHINVWKTFPFKIKHAYLEPKQSVKIYTMFVCEATSVNCHSISVKHWSSWGLKPKATVGKSEKQQRSWLGVLDEKYKSWITLPVVRMKI